jgi:hypothetical protein
MIINGQYKFMWNGFTKLGVIKSINKYQSTARVIILEATGEHIFPLMVPEIKKAIEVTYDLIDIKILQNIYVCYAEDFSNRKIPYLGGMNDIYYILPEVLGEREIYFIGHDRTKPIDCKYINEEHDYLCFRMFIVQVRFSYYLN